MSLFYEPSMKIYKAQYGGSTENQYYPGGCPVPFMFYKVDAETGQGLAGACFELQRDGITIASGQVGCKRGGLLSVPVPGELYAL